MNINWGLLAPVIVLQFLLMITAFISLARTESVRGAKWIWVLIILFGNIAGSIVYFIIGRKEA